MTKIEFLNDIARTMCGRRAHVESTDCGQRYTMVWHDRDKWGDDRVCRKTIWIDTLPGGRISLKIKFASIADAERMTHCLWNAVYYSDKYVLDAAAKADVYETHECAYGKAGWAARLRMDKVW